MSFRSGRRARSLARLLVVAAFAALTCVAATASAEGPGGTPPPPCAPGQLPSEQAPCTLPPCALGQQPTREDPCRPDGQEFGRPQGDGHRPDGSGRCAPQQ